MAATKKIIVTQTRSPIKFPRTQRDTLRALGLRKIRQSVEHELNPSIIGMVQSVSHLVSVRAAGEGRTGKETK